MRSATALLLIAACGGTKPDPVHTTTVARPAYASAEALAQPRVFAPGVISTAVPEFAIAFEADGSTAYFNRASSDRKQLAIVASAFVHGAWQPAEPLPFSTGEFHDVDPFMAGSRLYFSSNRPRPGSSETDYDTWYVVRTGKTWGEPVHVEGAPSGPGNEVCVSIARDGTLYFQSDATGGGDIYRSYRGSEEAYAAAAPLDGITTDAAETNPAISPDGTLLVFGSDRDGGLGGSDLYITRSRAGVWSPARNLGAIVNSPFADFAPAFSPDGKYLFFTSERPGLAPTPASGRPPGDIYQIDVAALQP